MGKILKIRKLAENVNEYVIEAPDIAKKARAGQFVMLRVDERGERIPFTVCDIDRQNGTITILVQAVGYSTMRLAQKAPGESVHDFTGPLGKPTDLDEYNRILLVGGGIGCAVIYPQAKYLKPLGKKVDVILGARDRSLIIYEDEFRKTSDNVYITTDNGSYGEKGFVTDIVKKLLENNRQAYDVVFDVGPLVMMKAVAEVTRQYNIKTIVSMNPIMVDGTGMCGGCRVTVGGKTKYACVDGPEFDGHKIDFDEAINRSRFYKEQEQSHICKLTGEIRNGKN